MENLDRANKKPSNKKFGLFFCALFLLCGTWFYLGQNNSVALGCLSIALIFFILGLFFDYALEPLNKIWMGIGHILGILVSPLFIGLIFYGLLTPLAVILRKFGRDELRLKTVAGDTHWVKINTVDSKQSTFEDQF